MSVECVACREGLSEPLSPLLATSHDERSAEFGDGVGKFHSDHTETETYTIWPQSRRSLIGEKTLCVTMIDMLTGHPRAGVGPAARCRASMSCGPWTWSVVQAPCRGEGTLRRGGMSVHSLLHLLCHQGVQ